jgi:hypothetical protein
MGAVYSSIKTDGENAVGVVSAMQSKKRAALTTTIILSVLHLAFLFLGTTPTRDPKDWDNVDEHCEWQQNQVDAIRVAVWLTVPLWVFEMMFPMFLFGRIRESDFYKLGVFFFVIVNMIMTVTTAVPAVLFSFGRCEVEHWRSVWCWFAVVANIVGVSVAHFQGDDD